MASWSDGPAQVAPTPLVCLACKRVADDGARGWRAYVTLDEELGVYWPD
jgi:hypothetical protein